MRRLISGLACTGVVLGLAGCAGKGSASTEVDPAAAPDQWVVHGGDHGEQRHSQHTQIKPENLDQLGAAWFADLPERGQYQGTPLMVDGKLIVTTPWSKVYAFDAKSGQQLWKYDPKVRREIVSGVLCCNVANRGAAYYNGKVIWATLDGRLVAVDVNTGGKIWEAQTTDPAKALSITGAPRIGNGVVFIGQGGAEYLQRGYLSGWDAETGKKLWHWWAVPGNPADGFEQPELEWAAKTWTGEWWKFGGGGTPWDGIVYDPVNELVIFGTGNGSPWPASVRSPGGGDNLFTASIVALHARTGKYAWHYQTVPAESYDYDNSNPLTIADLTINGQKKRVVMQAPKNGFIYVIEAATGKVISADLTVPGANWLTGFDEQNNWRPILNPAADYAKSGQSFTVAPSQTRVWHPQAYNPQHGLIYLPTRWGSLALVAEPDLTKSKQGIVMGAQSQFAPPNLGDEARSYLLAFNPSTRQVAWKSTEGSSSNGLLSTASNLLFQGNGNSVVAFRADTGEKLWSHEMGANVQAGFITYVIDGVQYLTGVGAIGQRQGGRVVVFRLGGDVELPPPPPPVQQVLNPPANFGDAAVLARGHEKYQQHCTVCHEARLNVGGFPDLRYSPFLNSDAAFRAVVLDGALADAGMLPFNQAFGPADAEAIRAHLVSMANTLKSQPQRGVGGVTGARGGARGAGGAPGPARGAGGPGAPAGGAALPQQPAGGMGIFALDAPGLDPATAGRDTSVELHQ
ncbi:MAG TPA: PQQ-binding-like beta-propeller repeat protein [Steroidobacteraceae bacterium]|nr:PQQ-binding-like beta-propeller repeat protein [Steroidobacteraceae bacterium]